LIANRRSWTKIIHRDVAHDVWMECAPSAMMNRGQKTEYDDIKVHDVVGQKYHGLVCCEEESPSSTVSSYEFAKKKRPKEFFDINDGQKVYR